jgi:hypothetical protein
VGEAHEPDDDRGCVSTDPTPLTAFQVSVASLFFALPASEGFLLAGGAALAAQHLTSRPTHDLDLFTRAGASSVPEARDAFEAAARDRGWTVERIRDADTFCRLVVHGDEDLLVDLALDSPPTMPPSASSAGPTFGLEELAGRKVVALFDRAEARDFADVFALAQRYPLDLLIRRAAEVDAGFDLAVLATMLGFLSRFRDEEIPVDAGQVGEVRSFFRRWQEELRGEIR